MKPTMKPMTSAPDDGSDIEVYAHGRWWVVNYHDCQWMRDDPEYDDADDAWAIESMEGPGHIELHEAEGWRPLRAELV